MNNQQILEKAIQKAIDGGWDKFGYETFTAEFFAKYAFEETPLHRWEQIIFNHDFAKALWPEWSSDVYSVSYHSNKTDKQTIVDIPAWQYHLQQMVIAEDPIKYLGANL